MFNFLKKIFSGSQEDNLAASQNNAQENIADKTEPMESPFETGSDSDSNSSDFEVNE